MFANSFQKGYFSVLYSIGSHPLEIWDREVRNGHIKRITDEDIGSLVIEIMGSNVSTTSITCPKDPRKTLGIKLHCFVLLVKNLNKYFSFEIQILDDKNVKRRFRASNFRSKVNIKPFVCTMPLKMDGGWNQIPLNLQNLTKRVYGTNYVETLKIQIHANCRIRRIYFTDCLRPNEDIPLEYSIKIKK